MRCVWGLKAGWLIPLVYKRQAKMCDRSLTLAILSALEVCSHKKALLQLQLQLNHDGLQYRISGPSFSADH